jgi:hypothetical protein
LAHSRLLHAAVPGAVDIKLGASELLPMVAILPFMLYQLAGFGTMSYVLPKTLNWAINVGILFMITSSYIAYRENAFGLERRLVAILVVAMAVTVFYGVLKLKRMQMVYDVKCPPKGYQTAAKAA